MGMYVWEVKLEVEWKYTVTPSNGKSRTFTDVDSNEVFTVASSSGVKAIEVAKKVALDKERGYVDDWSSAEETTKAEPIKVLDVIGLELCETLDG